MKQNLGIIIIIIILMIIIIMETILRDNTTN